MRDYEIVYIFRSSFTAEEIEAKLERHHALITDGNRGEITAVVQWGKRQLAYPIQKQTSGHYVVAQFTAEPEVLAGLERVLKLDDDLLRYLVVLSEGELPLPVAMSPEAAPAPGSGDAAAPEAGVAAAPEAGDAAAPEAGVAAAPDSAEAPEAEPAAESTPGEDGDPGEAAADADEGSADEGAEGEGAADEGAEGEGAGDESAGDEGAKSDESQPEEEEEETPDEADGDADEKEE